MTKTIKTYSIGVDIGNSHTKSYSDGKQVSFPSLIMDGYDKFAKEEKISVEFGGNFYSVGIGSSNVNKMKYFNDKYKIMLLTAIALAVSDSNIKCTVTVGLPVSQFKNEQLRDKLKRQIESYGEQIIVVNSETKIIKIESVNIWVESGIVAINPTLYTDKNYLILDIGGMTRDSIEYIGGKPRKNNTDYMGIIALKQEIYQNFKADYNVDLDESAILHLFSQVKTKGNFFVNGKNVLVAKYTSIINNYIDGMFDMLEKFYSLADKQILLMGGGVLELKKYLLPFKEAYSFEILPSAEMLNAIAYKKISEGSQK